MSVLLLVLAAIAFAVKLFDGHIGSLDLVTLGLLFLTLSSPRGSHQDPEETSRDVTV